MTLFRFLFALECRALNAVEVFITLLPMLTVYPLLLPYFIMGITLGAVKEESCLEASAERPGGADAFFQ